jgi:aminopeptidase N
MSGTDWGFDALHHHELSHEWWGNLVTNSDWRDMWLHEGFGTYMQPLYVEYLYGSEAYHKAMIEKRFFGNTRTIAPREVTTAEEIYKAPIYAKGAWVLHTLRYLIGDDAFFKALKKMAYPDLVENPVMDGRQIRFATTDDFLTIVEEASGMELDWFFEIYLRQPELPVLYSLVENGTLRVYWKTPGNLHFPMPVEVKIGDTIKRYNIPVAGLTIKLKKGDKPEVDPDRWLLMEISK